MGFDLSALRAYRRRLREAADALPAFTLESGNRVFVSMLSMRITAILSTGILRDGQPGSYFEYSTRLVNTDKFRGQELNGSGKAYLDKNRLGTWADFRIAQGLKADVVSGNYTGRMLKSMKLVDESFTGGVYKSRVTSTDPVVLQYINDFVGRYGNFIKPTDEEKQIAKAAEKAELYNFLKKYL